MQTVTAEYLEGIREGRASLKSHGIGFAHDALRNLNETIKRFPASSPVGQLLRGERDFWRNQLKRST